MSKQISGKRIKVIGKVQGVGFRFYTQSEARLRRVSGFVKNMPDGSVLIEAEGEKESMMAFIRWCKEGPEWAKVDEIQIQEKPLEGFEGFSIK